MGWVGKAARKARTPRKPSARMSGVPASSQSTPARTPMAATCSASSMEIRSSESWTIGRTLGLLFYAVGANQRLDRRAVFQGVEGDLPIAQGHAMADHGAQIDLAGGFQAQRPLPGVPGVAEHALERHRLRQERIEAEVQGLGSPGDLGDLAVAPHRR